MDMNKTCAICTLNGAETVVLSIESVNAALNPVGTSTAMDLCPNCRIHGIPMMATTAQNNIEAAIVAV